MSDTLSANSTQLTWASGKPDEYVALDWQTQAAFAGQWQRAQDFSDHENRLGGVELDLTVAGQDIRKGGK